MKKLFIILFASAAFHVSCQKCQHCIHTYQDGDGVKHTLDLGTRCGEQDDIKAVEDSCIAIAAKLGGNCACTNN